MFLSGYDTLEYSRVKAITVFCALADLSVILKIPNMLSGTIAEEQLIYSYRTQFVSVINLQAHRGIPPRW
jgi:hypothetical protein